MRIAVAPSGAGFYTRPLWMRFSKRELEGPHGERILVEARETAKLEAVLAAPERFAALPTPGLRRYEIFEDDDPSWPGVVLRVSGTETRAIARVSTVELAHRLADLLDRLEDEEARRPKSVNHWNRSI
jgi:hypothetical protein